MIFPLCSAFPSLARRQQPAEYLLLFLGMPLFDVSASSTPEPTSAEGIPRRRSVSEILHAGHFTIYLQGSEYQLESWQLQSLLHLNAMVKQTPTGKTRALRRPGDSSVSAVLDCPSEASPLEGWKCYK